MQIQRSLNYARAHRQRFVSELKEFLRFPSVSSQPERAGDIVKCANWLARHLKNIGLDQVRMIPTRGNPIVYASWLHKPDRATARVHAGSQRWRFGLLWTVHESGNGSRRSPKCQTMNSSRYRVAGTRE